MISVEGNVQNVFAGLAWAWRRRVWLQQRSLNTRFRWGTASFRLAAWTEHMAHYRTRPSRAFLGKSCSSGGTARGAEGAEGADWQHHDKLSVTDTHNPQQLAPEPLDTCGKWQDVHWEWPVCTLQPSWRLSFSVSSLPKCPFYTWKNAILDDLNYKSTHQKNPKQTENQLKAPWQQDNTWQHCIFTTASF